MNIYISRANHINDRLCDVYKECYDELMMVADENKIDKIIFSQHDELGIDIPSMVFEQDNVETDVFSYHYDDLAELKFDDDTIILTSKGGYTAYMDRYWGDYFDVSKIGQIYKAVMEIVGNNDLKENEKVLA